MNSSIRPVILCGGSGTRLWPLSREKYPKQFAALLGERSLFQQCAERLRGAPFGKPIIVTAATFRFIVMEQLAEIGVSQADVLIEPEPRDTAAAVLVAALHAAAEDPEAVLLVAPSDHLIPDATAFRHAVSAGLGAVARGDIVTFGVSPDRPETGYGYLQAAAPDAESGDVSYVLKLMRFVEKPDAAAAMAMIEAGGHFWNAGIFLGKAKDFVAAFKLHAPDLLEPVSGAVGSARPDLGFIRLDAEAWSAVRPVSIDYAVMEKALNLSVVPLHAAWSDLGDWNAVWRESPQSDGGMVCSKGAHGIDSTNSLLRSEGGGLELVGIGLEDMIVVAMPDAVVVAPRERSQEVRAAVALLKEKSRSQATGFPRDRRPWGWFETVARGDRHQVKRLVVKPGSVLSLQSHIHRAEHWIVVTGTARVTIGDDVRLLSENESVYVPLGAVHRLENPGKFDLHVIEVQTGAYLEEDDIVRYEDVYSRTASD
jgi:mannose-1-phosphate guanylyltransferase/mannose-6-phosphate isomerase